MMPSVLVTGASRGIGLEFTRQYAADGWNVIATCREPDHAEVLRTLEGKVTVYRMDVTDGEQIAEVSRALGRTPLDLLVNSAGIFGSGSRSTFATGIENIDMTDITAWEEAFRVNAIGPFRIACAFLRNLDAGTGKTLVTLSSGYASLVGNTVGGLYAYRSSKVAANMVMRGLAADLAERGVITVLLDPGWVRTDMGGPRAPLSPEASVAAMRQTIAGFAPEDSGRFFRRDGSEGTW